MIADVLCFIMAVLVICFSAYIFLEELHGEKPE